MTPVRWAAPGRVNLIGEHTDYNDGFVLPFAIAETCVATVSPAPDGFVTVRSAAYPEAVRLSPAALEDALDGWSRYPLGVLWALRRSHGVPAERLALDIALESTVPTGAGLSSSAAVVCAVTRAVDDLLGLHLDDDALLAVSRAAETEFVGAPTGGMDQLASLRSAAGHVLFCDMRSLRTEAVPLRPEDDGLRLLVVDTRAAHSNTDGQYRERRESCERAAAELGVPALRDATPEQVETLADPLLRRRARHVVTENARVLDTVAALRAGRLTDVGPLLAASQASMRNDFEISVAEIDTAVSALVDAGALGARLTGGGFGGCVVALVPAAAVTACGAAVERAFAQQGFRAPNWSVQTPSPGAHRVP